MNDIFNVYSFEFLVDNRIYVEDINNRSPDTIKKLIKIRSIQGFKDALLMLDRNIMIYIISCVYNIYGLGPSLKKDDFTNTMSTEEHIKIFGAFIQNIVKESSECIKEY